jgi:hypothetical protein
MERASEPEQVKPDAESAIANSSEPPEPPKEVHEEPAVEDALVSDGTKQDTDAVPQDVTLSQPSVDPAVAEEISVAAEAPSEEQPLVAEELPKAEETAVEQPVPNHDLAAEELMPASIQPPETVAEDEWAPSDPSKKNKKKKKGKKGKGAGNTPVAAVVESSRVEEPVVATEEATVEPEPVVDEAEILQEATEEVVVDAVEMSKDDAARDVDTAQDVVTAQDAEAVPDVETVQDAEAVPDVEAVQDIEAVPDTKAIQDIEAIQDVDVVEEVIADEEVTAIQKVEAVQDVETVPDDEIVQDVETVHNVDSVKDSEPNPTPQAAEIPVEESQVDDPNSHAIDEDSDPAVNQGEPASPSAIGAAGSHLDESVAITSKSQPGGEAEADIGRCSFQ